MSELSDKALFEIQKAVKVEILTDKMGNEFTTGPIFQVKPITLPLCGELIVSTLTGFIDFCLSLEKSGIDAELGKFVHIESHDTVSLVSGVFGPSKQRESYLKASFKDLLGKAFQFGCYYDQESFIVGLQSLFEPTPERSQVLKVIGTIKENQVRETSDDGVTQAVSAKAGIALVTEVSVPNPVVLQPFRTFREIEQPASPFILRVRAGKEKPECALFEADGGRWKLTAIQSIKEYIEDKIELPIFA
jgi:hypothetical protein